MSESGLRERLQQVRGEIAERQRSGGWTHPVTLVAVTKHHPVETVRAAVDAGLRVLGENRVQEALEKMNGTADLSVSWHLIGTLQRNKARHVAGRFTLIHSIDRFDVADALNARMNAGTVQPILVQVNCSGEVQKGGVQPADVQRLLEQLRGLPGIEVHGLMTMTAADADEQTQRNTFALLRNTRDQAASAGHELPELSMGMSDDFGIAVEEGATMIRLGTALFGSRT